MAIKQYDIINLSEFCEYVNTNVKDVIQSKIKYNYESPPPNFNTGIKELFSSGKTLKSLNASDIGRYSIINFKLLYAQLKIVFLSWALVRKLTFKYTYGYWTNGSSNHYKHVTYEGYGYMAFLPSNADFSLTDLTGKIITISQIKAFVDELYKAWLKLADTYMPTYARTVCHSNCHSSCHGSGGRR